MAGVHASLGLVDPQARATVTIMVRLRQPLPASRQLLTVRFAQRQYFSRVELAERYGASPVDLEMSERMVT